MGNSCDPCQQTNSTEKTRDITEIKEKDPDNSRRTNRITLKGDPTNPRNDPFKPLVSSINFEISKNSSLNKNYSKNNPYLFDEVTKIKEMFKYSETALKTIENIVPKLMDEIPEEVLEYAPNEFQPNKKQSDKKLNSSQEEIIYFDKERNSTYKGEISDLTGLRQGFGHEILKTGSGYLGEWRSGKRSGFGRVVLDNGNCYIGEFNDEMANGFGVFFNLKSKITYVGEFKNNKQHGKGKESYIESDTWYDGEWVNNIKHGKGKYFFNKNESFYEGNWENGKMTGEGKMVYEDGSVYEGGFKEGVKEGRGVLTFESGEIYEGEFKNGKFNGKGKLFW